MASEWVFFLFVKVCTSRLFLYCLFIHSGFRKKASLALSPGVGLGAPSKMSKRLKEFPMEVPFAK